VIPFPLGHDTVIVTNRMPVLDVGGEPVRDSYNRIQIADVPITVTGAAFELLSSDETNKNVNPTTLVGRARLPWGTPVTAQSQLSWGGMDFEVHGPPRPWVDNDGVGDHIEVDCRLERG
jgi:hypothetical protein